MSAHTRELLNESARARRKQRMIDDPEYAARRKAYAKAYYQAHKEQMDAYHNEYCKTHHNAEKARATRKRWAAAHPDYYKEYFRAYRERKRKEKLENNDER